MSLSITVYTKDQCGECVKTRKFLENRGIPHLVQHISDSDESAIATLKEVAEGMGVAPSMPYVRVHDEATGDTVAWFGHRPDQIVQHITSKRARK
ncbi:glutaredoxin family protein [Glutamicibacter sp. PS]|uniref:glutaredoxin family protein n=1 Tax=Glutamicibacter sp. PS TaxID=3075634 RepID=UPI002849E6F1|nr:glutaredoxin family protein [Glutamicibacter sp. PS]MDR4533228.1 glutaredoxin family protein [Glutamicibacter sp. PS]